MKKKIFLFAIVLLFASLHCFAQNTEPKYYSDYIQGFSGYAVAVYQGNLYELNFEDENDFFNTVSERIGGTVEVVRKLTKRNNWLFRQALNEWDYEKDEVYYVICADSPYSTEALLFVVVVKGNDDFDWRELISLNNHGYSLMPFYITKR